MSGESIDIDAIEARVNAATPGPWTLMDERALPGAGPSSWVSAMGGVVVVRSHAYGIADTSFIAAARADVPALIARVRELEENAKVLDRELDNFEEVCVERSHHRVRAENAEARLLDVERILKGKQEFLDVQAAMVELLRERAEKAEAKVQELAAENCGIRRLEAMMGPQQRVNFGLCDECDNPSAESVAAVDRCVDRELGTAEREWVSRDNLRRIESKCRGETP